MDMVSRNVRLSVHAGVVVGIGVSTACMLDVGVALASAVCVARAALLGGRYGVGSSVQADKPIAIRNSGITMKSTLHNIRYAIRVRYCVSVDLANRYLTR